MVKRFTAFLALVAFAQACLAQSIGGFVVPPDLRSQPGGGYSAVAPLYKTDGSANTPIDPNVTAPPQVGLTPILNSTYTGRVTSGENAPMCPTTLTASNASVTAKIDNGSGSAGNTLTVTAVSSGTVVVGQQVSGASVSAFGTGTGGVGTYTITGSPQLVASGSMTLTVCTQAKFRTIVGGTHTKVLCDDPIRNYGQPGVSHCHLFFGNIQINSFSTYKSLRTAAQSDASGFDANSTGYWMPCFKKTNPFSDGHNYCVKPYYFVVYYLENFPVNGPATAFIPPGLRYVFLFNMDDQWAWLQSIIDSANTASGSRRYSLIEPDSNFTASISGTTLTVTTAGGSALRLGFRLDGAGLANDTEIVAFGTGTGGTGTYTVNKSQTVASEAMTQGRMSADSFYSCGGIDTHTLNANGSDPFNGNCPANSDFYVNVSGPNCWDRTNLWSPGGYKHVIPQIWDTVANGFVCPYNYSRIPTVQMEDHLPVNGPTDYMNWRLTSDDSLATACGCTVLNGETFHTDWMDGWDESVRQKWETNGIGAMNHTPHELNCSFISGTEHLIGGCGDTDSLGEVNVTYRYKTTSAGNMIMLPTSKNGPKTMNMHQ